MQSYKWSIVGLEDVFFAWELSLSFRSLSSLEQARAESFYSMKC